MIGAIMDAVFHHQTDPKPMPVFWRRFFLMITVGKSAIGGAGLALALLGGLNVAAAITAQPWLSDVQKHYLDYAALGGGVTGGALGWFLSRVT